MNKTNETQKKLGAFNNSPALKINTQCSLEANIETNQIFQQQVRPIAVSAILLSFDTDTSDEDFGFSQGLTELEYDISQALATRDRNEFARDYLNSIRVGQALSKIESKFWGWYFLNLKTEGLQTLALCSEISELYQTESGEKSWLDFYKRVSKVLDSEQKWSEHEIICMISCHALFGATGERDFMFLPPSNCSPPAPEIQANKLIELIRQSHVQ